MSDEQQVITVVLTRDLATSSLAMANAGGMSRSELVRRLLTSYLNGVADD
jgi:metal-responsive CopG/Arc/MetJ family transcriptional regulator